MKGRLVEYGTSGDSFWKTPPVDTIGTIELLPLDREPKVGDEVLVRGKITSNPVNGIVAITNTNGISYHFINQIIAILPPTEEKCSCVVDIETESTTVTVNPNCPIHGSKREEECDMVGEWEDCPKCHQPHYGENPKEDSK